MVSLNSDANKQHSFDKIDYDTDSQMDHSEKLVPYDVRPRYSEGDGSIGGAAGPNYQSIDDCGDTDGEASDGSPKFVAYHRGYSATKVRILVIAVSGLSSGMMTTQSVVSQYLLHLWSHEKDHVHGLRCNGVCSNVTNNEDDIQAKVSLATMHYSMTSNILSFVSCLLFGALVDIIGRKIALVSSLLGATCQHIVILCIMSFKLDPNCFFLAYALDGIGGSYFVNVIATYSITADISDQKNNRILGLVVLGSIATTMSALCNVIAGILIKTIGYVVAEFFIFVPLAISLLVTIVFLSETLPVPKQKISIRRVWDYTARIVYLYCRDGDRRTRWSLVLSMAIFFTGLLSNVGVVSIDTLYQKHEPFEWNAAQLGYYAAFRGSGVSVLFFIYFCIWRWCGCASDEILSMVGMLFISASLVLEAFVTNTWQMYMVPIVFSPGSNIATITKGVMSSLASPDQQGVIFSSVALIEVSCTLTGSIIYNQIYAVTVGFLPGFVYLIMAGIAIITFFLYIPFFYFYNRRPKNYEKIVQDP